MALASPHDAKLVLARLKTEGYQPILIGGLAIEIAGYGGTRDVDVLLPEAEYGGVEVLRGGGIEVLSNTGHFTNGHLRLANGRTIVWDVLNPVPFGGEAFYRFVATEGSRMTPVGRVANPSVVYYTRLLVEGEHGARYVLRIRRDLDEGAPLAWLEGTLKIAERFGSLPLVRPKVQRILRARRPKAERSTRPR
jgi:hypothetical protein